MFTENTFNKEFTIVEILFSIFKFHLQACKFVEPAPRKGLARRARARAAPKRVERLACLPSVESNTPTWKHFYFSDLDSLKHFYILELIFNLN